MVNFKLSTKICDRFFVTFLFTNAFLFLFFFCFQQIVVIVKSFLLVKV